MGAVGARTTSGLNLHPERIHTGAGRLSVLGSEQNVEAGSGESNGISTADNMHGSQDLGASPQQAPGAGGGRGAGPPQPWWRASGANGNDDASEYDEHVTAAGTITYGNENHEVNSDDTAPSISDEAAGSSDDDSSALLQAAVVATDRQRDSRATAFVRNSDAGPRMGGPASNTSQPQQLKRPNREKNLNLLLQSSSSPPNSFGQLLCSLPEAKPITQFPVPLDMSAG